MKNLFTWILFMILPCVLVSSRPMRNPHDVNNADVSSVYNYNSQNIPNIQSDPAPQNEQVISVRITSSVAVGRGKSQSNHKTVENISKQAATETFTVSSVTEITSSTTVNSDEIKNGEIIVTTDIPKDLAGANIEYIKQLNAKKETRGFHHLEQIHPFQSSGKHNYNNVTDDSVAEYSIKTILEISDENDKYDKNIENIPLARSAALSPSSENYIQGLTHKSLSERGNNPRLTTVSFNIVHDTPKIPNNYNEPSNTYVNPNDNLRNVQQYYNEPAKVYSQPAQVYSEPAKFYSEPAKVYSEPAKVYSEPAKVYSEPAKIYSEPAKFYSQPASLHLTSGLQPSPTPWQHQPQNPPVSNTIMNTTPITSITHPSVISNAQQIDEHQPEKNYEVDEKVSVMTDGRSHGVQESSTENCKQDNCKVGYVVEGRQYRKYRVEERTPDGFIVGEYGVVRNEDGALRGVRYTADSEASPRLIYDALMKFLQLR